uniref:Putative 39s ribosomal protein l41 mitochondrial agrilus planipennis n=1 Tax=Xenopsylla cheopis TaxID=163159 RepID=A0A6M2DK53_XENCH
MLLSISKSIPLVVNVCKRSITTTAPTYGKRNFRKFLLYNKRGSRLFKKQQRESANPLLPIDKRGVRDTGYTIDGKYIEVPEMIPELIVPDLTDFQLKPYVSYKTPEVVQSKFTSKDLFDAIYSKKISDDFKAGKLDENGDPLEPSVEEKLTAEEAKVNARKTGSDIF